MGNLTKFLLAILGQGIAQTFAQDYPDQSGPFTLRITAPGCDVDGNFLYACHSGAAISQLCVGNATNYPGESGIYHLNSSANSIVNGQPAGLLVWNMPFNSGANGTLYASEPLSFAYGPLTNVAPMIFIPGGSNSFPTVPVGFDAQSRLFLYSYVNQQVFPPQTTGGPFTFYQWHVCQTYFGGYQYPKVLAWATAGQPNNPSCVPVGVQREFLVLN